jgi:RNA polymerase sigma-70 factor (ECF subfamily)
MEKTSNQDYSQNGFPHAEQIALCAELKKGNRQAFARLVALSRKQLYVVIWRILRNHEDTNDILQDTYLRLYENAGRLHPDQPILPYLRRIAINLSINRLKATKRVISLDGVYDIPDTSKADREAEQNELIAVTRKAIAALPKEQQLVLMLRVQEGLSYQEIAEALQLRLGTVMSRLARAREKISRFVQKHHKLQKVELVQ